MGKYLIGCRCCAKHLNKKILKHFSGSRSTTIEPNFKILCNCIHELLNVFEDSAQCHVIFAFKLKLSNFYHSTAIVLCAFRYNTLKH